MTSRTCGTCRTLLEKNKDLEWQVYNLKQKYEPEDQPSLQQQVKELKEWKEAAEAKIQQLEEANTELLQNIQNALKMVTQAQDKPKSSPLLSNVKSVLPTSFSTSSNSVYSPPASPLSPVTPRTLSIRSSRTRHAVPVFCARNVADLPDVFDVLNNEGKNTEPMFIFHIEKYDERPDDGKEKLGVVLAMCGTDRVDITDKELLVNLREKKGFANVIMVILRRGSEVSKFKANYDASIPSGVGREQGLIQFIHFKGKILDAPVNKANIARFFTMAKLI